jgi:hypothetical protein
MRTITAGAALAVAMAAGAASAATGGVQPVYREIKQWVVACDNTRACVAKFVLDETGARPSDADPGYLEVIRAPGPQGAPKLVLQGDTHAPDPSQFRLDGKPITGSFPWRRDDGEATDSLTGPDAVRFIQAIRDGSLLSYAPAKEAPWVSLSGMIAALLAMDDAQGRVGGVTALAKPGPATASAVPPAAPLPVVRAAPARRPLANAKAFAAAVRKSQKALLAKHDICTPEQASEDEAYALNDAEALVILGCYQAAYQSSALVLRAPRTAPEKARQVIFPPQPTVDPKAVAAQDGEYVGASWDPKRAAFSESAKGRGLADCGESSTWVFDGKDFHLAQFNSLTRCGGGPAAGDWPTLYRAKVVTLP